MTDAPRWVTPSPADAGLARHLQAEADHDRLRAAWIDALAADRAEVWRDLAEQALDVLRIPEPTTDDLDRFRS